MENYVPLSQARKLVHNYIGITKLPSRLLKLKDDLFTTFVKVEILLNKLIILKILVRLNLDVNDVNINRLEELFEPILNFNFSRKLKYIKDNKLLGVDDILEIQLLSDYRNDFAHSSREVLIRKYYGRVRNKEIIVINKTMLTAPLAVQIEINDLTNTKSEQERVSGEKIPF